MPRISTFNAGDVSVTFGDVSDVSGRFLGDMRVVFLCLICLTCHFISPPARPTPDQDLVLPLVRHAEAGTEFRGNLGIS